MTFSEQLNAIMAAEDLTITEVAKKSGFSAVSISRYLKGNRIPKVDDASDILESLGYTITLSGKAINQKKNPDDELKKNASGYSDPTAYKAIRKVEKERERLMRLLDVIFTICDYAGFHVEERIVLKDKRTGKVWR